MMSLSGVLQDWETVRTVLVTIIDDLMFNDDRDGTTEVKGRVSLSIPGPHLQLPRVQTNSVLMKLLQFGLISCDVS